MVQHKSTADSKANKAFEKLSKPEIRRSNISRYQCFPVFRCYEAQNTPKQKVMFLLSNMFAIEGKNQIGHIFEKKKKYGKHSIEEATTLYNSYTNYCFLSMMRLHEHNMFTTKMQEH